jgi:hypothetical protein
MGAMKLGLGIWALWGTSAWAAPPQTVPVTGYIVDTQTSDPLDGDVGLRLRLYTTLTGGTPIFDESQTVLVDEGTFSVALGSTQPLDFQLFRDNSMLYLGLEVDGSGAEVSPRFQIGTAPFAAVASRALDAETLGGLSADELVPADLRDGDADTTYTAGAGLVLSGTEFAADEAVIQAWALDVCPDTVEELSTVLDPVFVDDADLEDVLLDYPTRDDVDTALVDYVLTTDLTATLRSYVTSTGLTSTLGSYVTTASLTSTLGSYVTTTSLTSTLGSYVTTTSLTSTLGSYVTTSSLTSTLGSYVTSADLSTTLGSYVTASSLASTLGSYVTSSSLTSTLSAYTKSADVDSKIAAQAILRPDGTSRARAVTSCRELKELDSSSADGFYWVDPDGGSRNNAFEAYCEMDYDGGGWTLVAVDVFGDTGPGRLVSGSVVEGQEVVTCSKVSRSWSTSCWRASRHLLASTTEILVKGGIDKKKDGSFDGQLAWGKVRLVDTYPDRMWYSIVGNHRMWLTRGEIYNFKSSKWETLASLAGDTSNCNHHSKVNIGVGGWIHWNTANTEGCGGTQTASWTRNDIPQDYYDAGFGDPTNRNSNVSGMMVEVYLRGR